MKFQTGNPGRPHGSITPASVAHQCRKLLTPFAVELTERCLEKALAGDSAALAAVMNTFAAVTNICAAEAKPAKQKQSKTMQVII